MSLMERAGKLLSDVFRYKPDACDTFPKDELETTKQRSNDIQRKLAIYEGDAGVVLHKQMSASALRRKLDVHTGG